MKKIQKAGFGRRLSAEITDIISVSIINFILGIVLGLEAFTIFCGIIYSSLFISSSWQTTPGKKIHGVKVVTSMGEKLSFIKAVKRHICKYAPMLVMYIFIIYFLTSPSYMGYFEIILYLCLSSQAFWFIIIMFNKEKLAIHDMICKTMVVNKNTKELNPASKTTNNIILIGRYAVLSVWLFFNSFILVNLFDEKLDDGLEEFFNTKETYDSRDNALIAIWGINSPAEIKDIYEFVENNLEIAKGEAEKKYNNYIVENTPASPLDVPEIPFKVMDADELTYYRAEPYDVENEITFLGKKDSLNCWSQNNEYTNNLTISSSSKQGAEKKEPSACATELEIDKMLKDNELLLERYYSAYKYSRFTTKHYQPNDAYKNDLFFNNAGLFVKLNNLIVAQMQLKAKRGQTDNAINQWINNVSFIKNALTDSTSFLDKTILLVALQVNLQTLPKILNEDPNAAKKYHNELKEVLEPFGPEKQNIKGAMEYDYRYIDTLLKVHEQVSLKPLSIMLKPNATRNDLYRYAKDIVWISEQPASEFDKNKQDILPKYEKYSSAYDYANFYNFVGNLVSSPLINATSESYIDFINIMHTKDAQIRMLRLYVDILADEIPKEQRSYYIRKADTKWHNPITGKPFNWDEEKNRIYFDIVDQDYPDIEYQVIFDK